MFGFLNPGRHSPEYRRAYARCCQHQHLNYGVSSLPFMSFEAVFLYLCTRDAAGHAPCTLPCQQCCRLQTSRTLHQAPDAEIGRFCSAFSLILAATKFHDDIRDGRSLKARFCDWALRKRFQAARRYLTTIDGRFEDRIDQYINRHLEFERAGGCVALHDYTQPTAEAFGYVFGLMSAVRGAGVDTDALAIVGQQIGAALIAFDCAFDWQTDRKKGEFNPLPDEAAVHSAVAYCQDRLIAAAHICRRSFGDDCETGNVLMAVKNSIVVGERPTIYRGLQELARQWGFVRQKGAVQLNSDCGTCFWIGCCCLICGAVGRKEVHVYHHNGC